ncbi:uncharacterized protein [Drosophila suzukii]|uniref:Uncharacterized protein n=1 Tax=Drosophila suzukii TaxID=28584 RepID=A0ABM4TUC9_DROSZ
MDLSKTMVMDEDAEVIYLLPSLSPNSVEDNSVEPRASSSSTSTDDNDDNIFEPSACSSSTLVDYVQVGNLSPVEPLSHQLVEDDLHVGNLPATVEDLPQMVFDKDAELVYLWTEAEPGMSKSRRIAALSTAILSGSRTAALVQLTVDAEIMYLWTPSFLSQQAEDEPVGSPDVDLQH